MILEYFYDDLLAVQEIVLELEAEGGGLLARGEEKGVIQMMLLTEALPGFPRGRGRGGNWVVELRFFI